MAQSLLVTGGEKNPSKIRKYRIFLKKNKQTVLVSFCFYHFLIPFRNTPLPTLKHTHEQFVVNFWELELIFQNRAS